MITVEPVLDQDILLGLRRDWGEAGAGLILELIAMFLSDAPSTLAQLRQAYDCGDCEAAARLAHRMKGGAGQVGAVRLRLAAAELEQRMASGDCDSSLATHIDALDRELDQAAAALKALEKGVN